jgi:hypothetical protein
MSSQKEMIIKNAQPAPVVNGRIYWHLDESLLPVNMTKAAVLLCVQKAFNFIQTEFGHIRFEMTNETAPIIISFKNPDFFEIPKAVAVAEPYSPENPKGADVFLNLKMDWSEFHKPGGFSLVKVLVHEILHALGINHSTNPADIMFFAYQENDSIVITDSTRQAIKEFYGLSHDSELVRLWIKENDFLGQLNDRTVISLGKLLDLKLSPLQTKQHNIRMIKKRLGI